MLSTVSVTLPAEEARQYDIHIGAGLLDDISSFIDFDEYSQVFVLSDHTVAEHYLDFLKKACPTLTEIIISQGEEAKNLITLDFIWSTLATKKADRRSLLVNLGGGVIGDMGGFAAATYMRGIDFIQIPTTLLSQVDASVGGKVAIDFAKVKNLVGAFAQPKKVIIDVDTLDTLPERELRAGYAEILKHGFISDTAYLQKALASANSKRKGDLAEVIQGSCTIKAKVVEADECESGYRKILNFGHTVGHALESHSHESPEMYQDGPLLHGEAISLGMVVEAHLSHELGMLSREDLDSLIKSLDQIGLPISLPSDLPLDALEEKMLADKKNVAGELRFTLLEESGKATFDHPVSLETLRAVLTQLMSIDE